MNYPFKVFQTQVEDHIFWVAESTCLKGCVAQGDTIEEALSEFEENEKEWLETAEKYAMAIPAVPIESMVSYSGKFMVRVAPYIHEEAVQFAKKQNISLNQYVNDAIVAQNSRMSTIQYIASEVVSASQELKKQLFTSASSSKVHSINTPYSPSLENRYHIRRQTMKI